VIPPHKLWPNNPSYGIVVRNEFMQQQETILKFLEQHERASNLIREDPRKAAEIVSKLTQIVDPEFVVEAYKISPKYCASLSKEYVRSTMGFVQVLKDLGYINRQITENEIFYYRFIEKVHPYRPHYDIF
jgi:NitT/TauT family transport system substrate-binding protein